MKGRSTIQSAAKYRMLPDDIQPPLVCAITPAWCRSRRCDVTLGDRFPPRLERYNGYSALEIVGEARPRRASVPVPPMDIMETVPAVTDRLWLEWTAMSTGNSFPALGAPATLYAAFHTGGVPLSGGAV